MNIDVWHCTVDRLIGELCKGVCTSSVFMVLYGMWYALPVSVCMYVGARVISKNFAFRVVFRPDGSFPEP